MGFLDKLNSAAQKAGGYAKKLESAGAGVATSLGVKTGLRRSDGSVSGDNVYLLTYDPSVMLQPVTAPMAYGYEDLEKWQPVTPTAKTFPLCGRTLELPDSVDKLNAYKLMFRSLAQACCENLAQEYARQIDSFPAFVERFSRLYDANLYPMVKRAADVLVAENIWTETPESISEKLKEIADDTRQVYDVVMQAALGTAEANQQVVSGLMSFASGLAKNSLGGLGGELLNSAGEYLSGSTGMTMEQQAELYARLDWNTIMPAVYVDYYLTYAVVWRLLCENGLESPFGEGEALEQAKRILQNLSNPNIPEEKYLEMILQTIHINPYEKGVYESLIQRIGDTDEVRAIREYFGFTDMKDPRIIA